MSALSGGPSLQVLDIMRGVWRRRWLALVIAWTVSVLGWAGVAIMPDSYKSMTRIYVQTDNLLTPLLRNITVQTDTQKQVEVLQRTVLNRGNMAEVVLATDLDIDVYSEVEKEALYTKLQKAIEIKAEGNNLFSLTYSNRDPVRAKRVVEKLLNIFVESNVGQNRTNMESARSFIDAQIEEYENKLKEAEKRTAEFKGKHREVLAVIGSNFSAGAEVARRELSIAKIKAEEAINARAQIRAHLVGVPQFLDVASAPQVVVSNGGVPATSLRGRIRQLEAEQAQLKMRFTDKHPDVLAVNRALEELRSQAATEGADDAPANSGRNRVSNAVYEQIKLRLVQADTEVAVSQGNLHLAEENVQRLNALGETAPKVEAEQADLNREYGVLRSKFEELLARRESARISQAVEASGDKLQFRIVEPPKIPLVPAWPNRPLLMAAVLVVALGVGAGTAYLFAQFDDTIASAEVLSSQFNIRVIGIVPRFENFASVQARRRGIWRFAAASASLLVAFGLVVMATQLSSNVAAFASAIGASPIMERIFGHGP